MKEKRKVKKLPDGINLIDYNDWLWFMSNDYLKWFTGKRDHEFREKITGKYLFFHENPKILSKLARNEIKTSNFHVAKINKTVIGNGKDHVLCLYYKDDSLKDELAERYQDKNGIRYRYWKSDEDTKKGKYSKQFLDRFQNKK